MNNEWYKYKIDDVFNKTNSTIEGLNSKEVKKRLEKNGYNVLPKKKKDSIVKVFFSEFNDPIVLLLLVAVILSFLAGEVIDAVAILFILLIDAIIGTAQEVKAEKSAEALESLIKVKVKVLRDGKEVEIDSSELVIGDIVLLEPGNKIAADLRIVESKNLTIDEAILTGESLNSVKNNLIIDESVTLAERKNMLFSGTNVITGRGTAVVVETGINTEIGKIAEQVSNSDDTPSPLTIRMNKFSKQITTLIIIIAIIVTAVLISKGNDLTTVFLSVIALAVSAMPEGLPLALTMALTIGSTRMASKNVIVKKLKSVESLGSCTVIASDKTGTLTVNQQTAKKIILPNNQKFDISGIGYNNDGEIIPLDNADINKAKCISELGFINNEAKLYKEKRKWTYIGDSMDVAFLALGYKSGIKETPYNIIGEIPYESENKYSAVFYEKDGKTYCTVKGSLEKIFSFCSKMDDGDKEIKLDETNIKVQNEELASDGFRVIAIADGEIKNFKKKEIYDDRDIKNLTFKGLVAFIDPIRKETIASISDCKRAGIKVVMVTGDHPLTAFAIAKELNIASDYSEVATGDDIEKISKKSEKEFDKFIKEKTIFTRVTPLQKLSIVNSFKRQGEFVAVTGDGVNDAPAIKAANIGIAMGSGTDVAKETSSMIIIDDNFLSIVAGIKEGRNAYSNIRKIVYFLISCGLAEVLFFLLSTIFNLPMPLVAIQLLWLNVVTDGLQDLALSFEKDEDDVMADKPRDTKESLFDKVLIQEIAIAGLSIGLIVFGVWIFLINYVGMEVEHARGYIMALMVFLQNYHVLNCRSENKSIFKYNFKHNPFVLFSITGSILLQIIVMEVEPLSRFLSTYSIPWMDLIRLMLISLPIIIIMEFYKYIKRKKLAKC